MEISHPRRILVIGAHDSGAIQVVQDLTDSAPIVNENGSTAGTIHEWNVKTAYYIAKIPIWMDEITSAKDWKTEFLKPEAQEVVEAIGAWIFCFRKSDTNDVKETVTEMLRAIQEVTEEHVGYGADTVMLTVAVPSGKSIATCTEPGQGEWEDLCIEHGFEYIDYASQGTNEFREKTGFARLKEALEANEWTSAIANNDDDDIDFDALRDEDSASLERDEAEMTVELFGMKAALDNEDDDLDSDVLPGSEQADQVDGLDRLLGKLLAIKENSADLPEAQRKRLAAQAVRDMMREENVR